MIRLADLILAETAFWYLATPYSLYRAGREAAFEDACMVAGCLLAHGVVVFSPIAHAHPVAARAGIGDRGWPFWKRVDLPLMHAAHGCLVVEMDGWRESVGVTEEIAMFEAMGKPVRHLGGGFLEGLIGSDAC